MKQRSYIFVTGGVCSSLGKGIVAASTAAILRSAGVSTAVMKLDPYLNVDPGTMSPFQHGEVFVLDDGAETDLDLGHYERFIDIPLTGACSVTTGKVYSEVLREERDGKYLGGTIQVVPHITNKIREKVEAAAESMDTDVMVVEIGGTVGDIEAEPFLEVLRQMKNSLGGGRVLSMHLTLLPYLAAAGELKTKPTQLSVRELRRVGITPDIILTRADVDIPDSILKKVAYFCDVREDCVIPSPTVSSIYQVPLLYQKCRLGEIVAEKLRLGELKFDLGDFERYAANLAAIDREMTVALCGKYTDLDDAYLSVIESIKSAGVHHGVKTVITWIDTEKLEEAENPEWDRLRAADAVVVPGGFGNRGIEGKIAVAAHCRAEGVPYLGLCLGSQIMAIEFARHVLGIADATSEEFDEEGTSQNHIVHFIPEQRHIQRKGGTMRLGAYDCQLTEGSLAHKLYGETAVSERHRHRFEFNNDYRAQFAAAGFVVSGVNPQSDLVEVVELADHPFMIGTQAHPEFLSRPWRPHPLFAGLVQAAL